MKYWKGIMRLIVLRGTVPINYWEMTFVMAIITGDYCLLVE